MVLHALNGGLRGGNDFGERASIWAKTASHFGAMICLPGRRIIKLFKAILPGKQKY